MRQFAWEQKASRIWQSEPWQAYALASYDLLIDETWVAGHKHKRRWSVEDAEWAVRETVDAAQYIAGRRADLYPRKLVLGCQGVDAVQYRECVQEVLRVATPDDWIGLGGWCILGRLQSWLPTFWATLYECLPLIQCAGVRHVHLYGVLWQPAVGGLVWLADQYGLSVSTDSASPVLVTTWKNKKRSGARCDYWRDNVNWWVTALKDIRHSPYYRQPPKIEPARQLSMAALGI